MKFILVVDEDDGAGMLYDRQIPFCSLNKRTGKHRWHGGVDDDYVLGCIEEYEMHQIFHKGHKSGRDGIYVIDIHDLSNMGHLYMKEVEGKQVGNCTARHLTEVCPELPRLVRERNELQEKVVVLLEGVLKDV